MVSTSQGFSYDQHSAQLSFKLPGGALSSPAQTHFVLISPRNFCLKTRDFTEWLPAAFKGGGWDPRPTTALFWGRNKAAPRALRHPEMKSPLVSGGRCCPPPLPQLLPAAGRGAPACLLLEGKGQILSGLEQEEEGVGGRTEEDSHPGPPGVGEARYRKTKRVFPKLSPFPTPFFFSFRRKHKEPPPAVSQQDP